MPLERTLSSAAVDAIGEGAMRARAEAAHYKDLSEEALQAVDKAADEIEQTRMLGLAAAAASAATSLVVGVAVGFGVARRRHAGALARVSAEMLDVRRRAATELERSRHYGSEKLAKSLIPALDAMDALCLDRDDEGSRLTRSALLDALRAGGVERIDPSVGDVFDVAHMEAMLTVPVAGTPGNVETVLRPGYILQGDRILRAAQVGVGAAEGSSAG